MNGKIQCNQYEALFIFRGEDELMLHIKNCPDCRKEHENQMKVSKLIKTVAPVYLGKKHRQKISMIKKLACCFILFTGFTAFTGYNMYEDYLFQSEILQDSYISGLGLPVDDYGFLEI